MEKHPQHLKGTLITLLGVLVLTPDGLLVRLISAESWAVLFWRGLFFATGIFAFYLVRYGKQSVSKVTQTGRKGILASFLFAGSTMFFILSLHNTSVANTLVIIATAPLWAAMISLVVLKEKPALSTWMAILVSCGAIAYIFKDSFGESSLIGNAFALGSAICIAAQFTTVRVARHLDMVPTLGLSGLILAALAFVLAPSLVISWQDFGLLFLLGMIILPTAFGLITVGPRYIPAAEVSLLMLLETALGPLWVWLVVGEQPSSTTLVCGTIVILTLVSHILYTSRKTASQA